MSAALTLRRVSMNGVGSASLRMAERTPGVALWRAGGQQVGRRSLWLLRTQPEQRGQRFLRCAASPSPARVVQATHRGFATEKNEGDKKGDEAPSALAVQNALTVQEKTEWQKKWDDFKGAAFQSRIFEHYKEGAERIDDFIEDSVSTSPGTLQLQQLTPRAAP